MKFLKVFSVWNGSFAVAHKNKLPWFSMERISQWKEFRRSTWVNDSWSWKPENKGLSLNVLCTLNWVLCPGRSPNKCSVSETNGAFKSMSEQTAHSESSKTSKMQLFVKIVNGWKLLTIFLKSSIRNVWLGSGYETKYLRVD